MNERSRPQEAASVELPPKYDPWICRIPRSQLHELARNDKAPAQLRVFLVLLGEIFDRQADGRIGVPAVARITGMHRRSVERAISALERSRTVEAARLGRGFAPRYALGSRSSRGTDFPQTLRDVAAPEGAGGELLIAGGEGPDLRDATSAPGAHGLPADGAGPEKKEGTQELLQEGGKSGEQHRSGGRLVLVKSSPNGNGVRCYHCESGSIAKVTGGVQCLNCDATAMWTARGQLVWGPRPDGAT